MKNNDVKNTVVPPLRFVAFRDTEGWEEKSLGDVATFSKGKGISKSDITLNGVLPCIRYGELYTFYKETIDFVKSSTNLLQNDLVLSQANDVIIPASGETKEDIATASCVIKSGIALGGDLNIIRTKMNGVFLSYYLNNAKKEDITQLAQGISVVHLYSGQLQKLKINVPKLGEQQKIAACLTSLDDLITAESQKLDALKGHKKGLMQQLFPAEGETVPQLRFEEWRDTEGWEEKMLGDFLEEYSERVSAKTELPIYSSTREGLMSQKDYYNNRELLNEGEYGVVPKGYFVYRHMSDDATFKFNINNVLDKIVVSKEYPVFKTINLDSYFLLYILNGGIDFKRFAEEQKKGGTRTRLYFKILCSWKTLIPSVKEQKKIAGCLSSLDELIQAQSDKIEALKEHKKGLMQQLFPNTEG